MIAEVHVLHEDKYKQMAEEFVDIYEEKGEISAGKWLADNLKLPNEEDLLAPYVRQIFIDRGYEVDDV